LESQGVIESVAGKGCFVTENNSPFKKSVRDKMLADEIDAAIVQAHHLQVDGDEFLGLVKERLKVFAEQNKIHSDKKP
jgi:DNA-binding transcriptional regulator YhcF (GntR family)